MAKIELEIELLPFDEITFAWPNVEPISSYLGENRSKIRTRHS